MVNNENEKPKKTHDNVESVEKDVRVISQDELKKLRENTNQYRNSNGAFSKSNTWNIDEHRNKEKVNQQLEQIIDTLQKIENKVDDLEKLLSIQINSNS